MSKRQTLKERLVGHARRSGSQDPELVDKLDSAIDMLQRASAHLMLGERERAAMAITAATTVLNNLSINDHLHWPSDFESPGQERH